MRKLAFIAIFVQLCALVNAQELKVFWDGYKYGYQNEYGKTIIPPIYTYAGAFIDNTAIVGDGIYYFLIDNHEKRISDNYSKLSYLGEKIFLGIKFKKKALIDIDGKVIQDVSLYDNVESIKNGYAIVKRNNKVGIINAKGEEFIPCIYDQIFDNAEFIKKGYAKVKQNNKIGIINAEGEEVVPCIYDQIFDIEDGYIQMQKAYQYGYFDKNYKVVIPCKYASKEQAANALEEYKTEFFSYFAKKTVEKELNSWQKKGEFEKIDTWKKRVTADTREAKIRELTQKAEKTFIETHQDKVIVFFLGEYDAENEVFLVENRKYGNLLVPVPIENAPQFKQQWASITKETKCFIDNDTINIAEVLFTLPNGEQYKYSNQSSLNYEMAEIDYNFEPIALDLQQNAQTTTRGQQQIKSSKWTLGVSEVDVEIPASDKNSDNTFAVIIANENYQKEAQVPFAVNDGRTFAEYCKKTLGIPANNVHIVTDATLNNMKYEVRWLKQVIDAYGGEARVIFYYAGHGIPDEAQKTAYLLPVDGFGNDVSTGYKLDDLYSTLGNLPSKSVTVFLDACFSGANRDGQMLASARGVAIKAKSSAPVGNMVVFSAAQGDETAYPNNEQQHGMFTYYLLKKIKETSGNVTYKELGDYVTDNVRKQSIVVNGKSQTPTVVPSATVGGNWETWKLK